MGGAGRVMAAPRPVLRSPKALGTSALGTRALGTRALATNASARNRVVRLLGRLAQRRRAKAERLQHRLVVVDHGRLIAAVDRVGLRAGVEAELDRAAGGKILARDDIKNELHVLVP